MRYVYGFIVAVLWLAIFIVFFLTFGILGLLFILAVFFYVLSE